MSGDKRLVPIIRDTREQQPLEFAGYDVRIMVDTLGAGDYTLAGHDQPSDDYSIIIERKKDCRELATNLCTENGWRRFLEEAEVLCKYKHREIVVCSDNNFEFLISRGYLKTNLSFVYSRLAYLRINYGLSCTFMSNRSSAENYIYRLFTRILSETYATN